ncbi:RNA-binding KH domain-containing protein PEPPER-like protein [Tanacetum coccineum]
MLVFYDAIGLNIWQGRNRGTLVTCNGCCDKSFKRVNGFPDDEAAGLASVTFCSILLLVPSMQAITLIGKQGSTIKAIQETTGCAVRVLSTEGVIKLYVSAEDKIVDLQGEAAIVLKGLEAVDHHITHVNTSMIKIKLFYAVQCQNCTRKLSGAVWAERSTMNGGSHAQVGSDHPLSLKRESLFLDVLLQRESRVSSSGLSLYGRDHELPTTRSSALGIGSSSFVTQVAQTMQIPVVYAEDIIGVGGTNIQFIRRTSGAILTVQESQGLSDEMTIELKGTSLQECIDNHKDSIRSGYGNMESGLRSSYSRVRDSFSFQQPYDGYGMSGLGDYSSYRM